MEKITDKIRECNPSLTDWSVTNTVVTTMGLIVGSIINNYASVRKWIIPEAIVDTMRINVYFHGDDLNDALKVGLYHMVEEKDCLGETRQLRKNLEETHMKIRGNVKSKTEKYLEPLLHVPSSDKYPW